MIDSPSTIVCAHDRVLPVTTDQRISPPFVRGYSILLGTAHASFHAVGGARKDLPMRSPSGKVTRPRPGGLSPELLSMRAAIRSHHTTGAQPTRDNSPGPRT